MYVLIYTMPNNPISHPNNHPITIISGYWGDSPSRITPRCCQSFRGAAFVGGFSYADTLDSAKGLGPELGPSEATTHGETTA